MKILIFLILFYPVNYVYAQTEFDEPLILSRISFNLGYNQVKEENLHPKVFSGLIINPSYSLSKFGKNTSEYCAGLKVSLLNTAYEDFPSAIGIALYSNYKYLFFLAGDGKLNYSLGPIIDLQYGTYAFFNWDESHFYYANYISGGISSRISHNIGNSSFEYKFDIPIVSIICRPELNRQFKIDDMTFWGVIHNLASNPEFTLPNKNFLVNLAIEWKYNIKGALGYNFKYHFMQASAGKPYQNIEHTIHYIFTL